MEHIDTPQSSYDRDHMPPDALHDNATTSHDHPQSAKCEDSSSNNNHRDTGTPSLTTDMILESTDQGEAPVMKDDVTRLC